MDYYCGGCGCDDRHLHRTEPEAVRSRQTGTTNEVSGAERSSEDGVTAPVIYESVRWIEVSAPRLQRQRLSGERHARPAPPPHAVTVRPSFERLRRAATAVSAASELRRRLRPEFLSQFVSFPVRAAPALAPVPSDEYAHSLHTLPFAAFAG